MDNTNKCNQLYFDNIAKIIGSLASSLPQEQRRAAMVKAMRLLAESGDAIPKDGSSVVFPVMAIPSDADLNSVINLVSGMGAVVLSAGQARPTTTVKEVMDIADVMMGREDIAFSGDPNGIGLPVASAIVAAASADPDIIEDASKGGLSKIICDLSQRYDCSHHEGPLSMVSVPSFPDPQAGSPLTGGMFDFVRNLFKGKESSVVDELSDKAERKLDNKSNKKEKLEDKVEDLKSELTQLEAQMSTVTDEKTRKKLQRKIDRLKKRIARKSSKIDAVTDQIEEWREAKDKLSDKDEDHHQQEPDDGGTGERGRRALRDDNATAIISAAERLKQAGLPDSLANILSGFLIPNGVSDPLGYLSSLSSKLELSLVETGKYVMYCASGMSPSDAMDVIKGREPAPADINDYLSEARAKNEAYRATLQRQINSLRNINEQAEAASRLYVRSEWADAILSSSDEVADWLATVSPDASTTSAFIASISDLFSQCGALSRTSPVFESAIRDAISTSKLSPQAGYLLTGDPQLVPLLVVGNVGASGVDPSRRESTIESAPASNPVTERFINMWDTGDTEEM